MPSEPLGPHRVRMIIASTAVAWNLAVAQPVLDLLGRFPEFLIAHGFTSSEIVVLGIVLTLGIPAALSGIVLAVRAANARAAVVLHAAMLTMLFAVTVLQFVEPIARRAAWVQIGVALAAGATLTAGYLKRRGVSLGLLAVSPVPLIVLGLFLFGSPASKLVVASSGPTRSVAATSIERPAPIVMLILDEFPLASLMDREGGIDKGLYPNFARLARDGTWFRDATTVDSATSRAVPALLTGKRSKPDSLPILAAHPQNLFTILADRYRINAIEPVTALCPASACSGSGAHRRDAGQTFADLRLLLLHALFPRDITEHLPRIDQAWAGFAEPPEPAKPAKRRSVKRALREAVEAGRASTFASFIASITDDEKSLSMLHVMLPHTPWTYLPSGVAYAMPEQTPSPGSVLGPDPIIQTQLYQRHLLQVGAVDSLIGKLIARLEGLGIYDETLLVVTSDHGASFVPGTSRRNATRETLGHIAHVPLFVKRPGGSARGVNDRPVETIDVVPTILEAIGARTTAEFDGVSAYRASRHDKAVYAAGEVLRFSNGWERALAIARTKYARFARRGSTIDLFHLDLEASLLGSRPPSLPIAGEVTLGGVSGWRDVDLSEPVLPLLAIGRMRGSAPRVVALALNDRFSAISHTYTGRGREGQFLFLIPPGALREGANKAEVYEIASGAVRARWRVRLA